MSPSPPSWSPPPQPQRAFTCGLGTTGWPPSFPQRFEGFVPRGRSACASSPQPFTCCCVTGPSVTFPMPRGASSVFLRDQNLFLSCQATFVGMLPSCSRLGSGTCSFGELRSQDVEGILAVMETRTTLRPGQEGPQELASN